MILADYQAVSRGLSSISEARAQAEQQQMQRDILRRQMEKDAVDEELRRAALKQQEDQMAAMNDDRQTQRDIAKKRLEMDTKTHAWAFDPQNPTNRMHSAQVGLINAQADTLAAKPSTPLSATTQGIDEFSDAMASALEENKQAMAFAQANPQHPDAQRRVAKAQLKLSGLQEFSKTMLQKWKPETDHAIDLEMPGTPGADGMPEGKLRMKVPLSQWNEQHPLWSKFNAPSTPSTPTATLSADGIPTLTPQQAQAAKPGTKFRTTDGRLFVR